MEPVYPEVCLDRDLGHNNGSQNTASKTDQGQFKDTLQRRLTDLNEMKGMDGRGVQWERGDMMLEGTQGWNTNKAI